MTETKEFGVLIGGDLGNVKLDMDFVRERLQRFGLRDQRALRKIAELVGRYSAEVVGCGVKADSAVHAGAKLATAVLSVRITR